jgi:hypothetical protein
LGAFDARRIAMPFASRNCKQYSGSMDGGPFLFESKSGKSRYTRLFACISEEEDCYTVQVRLSNGTKPEDSACGEEIADSFETASELVAALAGEFSIVQACIKIEIRMHNHKHSTRH